MKKGIFNTAVITLLALALAACSNRGDYDDRVYDESLISMTAAGNINKVRIALIGTRDASIDWGDGNKQDFMLSATPVVVEHAYASVRDTCEVKITGTNITAISCNNNRLISLDVSQSPYLEFLNCESNKIPRLTLTENTALVYLYCSKNEIMSLNLYKNTLLLALTCAENYLSALDLTKNTELQTINCESNHFGETALNEMFNTLHRNPPMNNYKELWIDKNLGTQGCDRIVAQGKGWAFMTAEQ